MDPRSECVAARQIILFNLLFFQMKKLLLLSACFLGGLSATPALAQYSVQPHLNAGRNPGRLNTENELRYDQGMPGWSLLLTGDANTQASPVWSAVQTLPFGFQMGGQTLNNYKVSSSGVLTFSTGATVVPPSRNDTLPSALVPNNSVCMWGTMLAPTNDYIISKTFGTAPNRQHWVMFNSVSVPAGGSNFPLGGTFMYASIVLEETTNKVYLVWQYTGGSSLTLTPGVQLSSTSTIQLPGSPFFTVPNLNNLSPADNGYYEFEPGVQLVRDASPESLSLPNTATKQSSVQIQGTFSNLGSQAVNSLTVSYQVGGGAVVSAPISGLNVPLLGSAPFVHPTPWQVSTGGVVPVKVWLSNPNGQPDLNPANDTLRTTVVVPDSTMRRKVVEEVFTGSTCPPCRPGNANMEVVNAANPGKFVQIRYQQNIPGIDPYTTPEGAARLNYYGISGIPHLMLDGGWSQTARSLTTPILNQYQARPALVRVRGTYTLTGPQVGVAATVRPLLAIPAGRLVAHAVVTERRTVLNARNNGETVFHDVMKKMLPNQNGTPLPALASGQDFPLNLAFDAATLPRVYAVENYDSLRVVVFVQDVVTKEIYQGEYMTLNRTLATRSAQNGPAFSLAPNPATGRTVLFTTLARSEQTRVDVVDGLGRVVLTKRLSLPIGAQQVELDLGRQAAGLYTVRLTTSEGVSTAKLALE